MSSGVADTGIGPVDDWRLQSIKVSGYLDPSKEYTLSVQCVMAKSRTPIIEEKLQKLPDCMMLSLGSERRSVVLHDGAELKFELASEGFFSKKEKLKESVGTLLRDSQPQADGFREVCRTTQKATTLQLVFGLRREQDSIGRERLLKETREMIEAVPSGQYPKLRQIEALLPVALDAAEIVGQVVPVVNIVVASLRLVLKVVAQLRDTSNQITQLIESIAEIMPFIQMAASSNARSQPLIDTLSEMDAAIRESCKVALEYLSESKTKRVLASITGVSLKSSEELQSLTQLFKKLLERFDRAILHDTRAEVYELSKQRMEDILARLPIKLSSCYSAKLPSCTTGTRAQLLKELRRWSHAGGSSVYWLYGMAGLGKTAVAASFCKALQDEKMLAVSFFCTRDMEDESSILPTLAYQFAYQWPPYHAALAGALERLADVKGVAVMTAADQLTLLFIDPLNSMAHEPPQPFTFVVDGLDHVKGSSTERMRIFDTFVQLLFQLAKCKSWIKIFVTMRSELSAKTITANSWDKDARVHNIRDEYDTDEDIRKYLAESLRKSEDPAWPKDDQISELARRAHGLFIWAHTVNLYLEDSLAKSSDLDDIIASDRVGDEIGDLYALYARICAASIDRDHGRKNLDRFVATMGAILATSSLSPIPAPLLEEILEADNIGAEVLKTLVKKLGAVMFIDSDEVVSVYHSSFSDFLMVKKRSGDFHVHIEAAHARVASACLSLINKHLDTDRDGRFEVSELLDYCSRYWCKHLELCGESEMSEARLSMQGVIEKFLLDDDDRRVKWWLAALDQAGLAHEAPWLLTTVKRKFPPLEERLHRCILVAFETVTGYVPSHSYLDLRDDQFCMEGTRVRILDDMHSWCGRKGAESVFWLYSNGGLGKTAVAASLCRRLKADGSLAGAYFCSVDDPLLSQECLPTLAWSLVEACEPFAVAASNVLRKMESCTKSDAEELILRACDDIEYAPGALPKSMTYIVDALDECDSQSTPLRSRVTHVINKLSSKKGLSSLKFVITGRPEAEVEALVSRIDSSRVVRRDLSQERDTNIDLLAFCRSCMTQVAEAHRLSLDWPGAERIQKVVQYAQGSFLWIQMLYNFLLCSSNSEDLLQRALPSAPGDCSEDYKRLYALFDGIQEYHTISPQGSNQIAEGRRLGFARKITRGLTEVPPSLVASERGLEYKEVEVLAPTDVQPKYRALHEGIRIASYKGTRVMVRHLRWHTLSEEYSSDDEDGDGDKHPKMVDSLLWAHYRHPNIQSIRAFMPSDTDHSAIQDVCIVYPHPDRLLGNLYEVLSQDLVVKWKTFPLQIARGLAYLHNQAASHHGSLSVFHILVDENSNLQITHPQFPSEKASNWNHKPDDAEPRTQMGDVYVWATITLLVYIKHNFPRPKHLWKAYNPWYASEIDYGKGMDTELYELVKKCQVKDPLKRPLIGEVVEFLERKEADGKV